MSNEVLKEDYRNLYKSDIFSLGASVYELARGKALPLKGEEWGSIRNGRLEQIEGFPDKLNSWFLNCMAIQPKDRPLAKDLHVTLEEPAIEEVPVNEEVKNLEAELKIKTEETEKLKSEIPGLKKKHKFWQDKFIKLVQRYKQSSNDQQFNLCSSFNLR